MKPLRSGKCFLYWTSMGYSHDELSPLLHVLPLELIFLNSSNKQHLYSNRVSEVHGSIPSTARASLNLVCQTLWHSVVELCASALIFFGTKWPWNFPSNWSVNWSERRRRKKINKIPCKFSEFNTVAKLAQNVRCVLSNYSSYILRRPQNL